MRDAVLGRLDHSAEKLRNVQADDDVLSGPDRVCRTDIDLPLPENQKIQESSPPCCKPPPLLPSDPLLFEAAVDEDEEAGAAYSVVARILATVWNGSRRARCQAMVADDAMSPTGHAACA